MTSVKDAIKLFMESDELKELVEMGGVNGDGHKVGKLIEECEVVRLCPIAETAQPISKLDKDLSILKNCKHLRLSSNNIEKLTNLSLMPNLTILSVGRNLLKSLAGVADISGTLVQLWCSYNKIGHLGEVAKLIKLEVFFCSNNLISQWAEVDKLAGLPKLKDVSFVNNPISMAEENKNFRLVLIKKFPNLKTIDGGLIDEEERNDAATM